MSSFRRARSGRTVIADARNAHYLAWMWTYNLSETYLAVPVRLRSGTWWWRVRRATLREVLAERNRLAGEVNARIRRGETNG